MHVNREDVLDFAEHTYNRTVRWSSTGCYIPELGEKIVLMEEKAEEAKRNAQTILEDAAAKAEEENKRRDAAIREERKLQDKLAAMVKAKEDEIISVKVGPALT